MKHVFGAHIDQAKAVVLRYLIVLYAFLVIFHG